MIYGQVDDVTNVDVSVRWATVAVPVPVTAGGGGGGSPRASLSSVNRAPPRLPGTQS